ncbi:MAG: hypothetical protein KAJ73_10275 [Zetaproteobacteria bacterium]|nr:hypothetical protein [Zetaproteobacteria bacterium]
MSRQLEQVIEERQAKRARLIVRSVEFELAEAVGRAGGELTGLAVKYAVGECLVVVKARLAGQPQVAFVGAEDFGSCLIKAVREARTDRLRWQADRYGGES